MEKEFVPHQESFDLRELGFDEECFSFYNSVEMLIVSEFLWKNSYSKEKDVVAPLWQQAFRWFREKHGLSCSIELTDNSRDYYYDFIIYDSKNRDWNDVDCFDSCKSIYGKEKYRNYEEAELECLKKLISIVKKSKL